MKNFLIKYILPLLLIAYVGHAQTCQVASKYFGSSKNDYAANSWIDRSGNVYVVGQSENPGLNFNNGISLPNKGSYDAYIAKYNPKGVCIWAASIGSTGSDQATSVCTDDDGNVYVTGDYSGPFLYFNNGIAPLQNNTPGSDDAYFAKYDANGNCLWAKNIGDKGNEVAYGICIDSHNQIYVVGTTTSSSLDFGNGFNFVSAGNTDSYVAVYDNIHQDCVNLLHVGDNGDDIVGGINYDRQSDMLYIAGFYTSSNLNINQQVLSNFHPGTFDSYIARIDPALNCDWIENIGGDGNDCLGAYGFDNHNNMWISCGYFDSPITLGNISLPNLGGEDSFLAKCNDLQNHDWQLIDYWGGTGDEHPGSLSVNVNNIIGLAAFYSSPSITFMSGEQITNNGGFDAFVAFYDQNGSMIKVTDYGSTGVDRTTTIVSDNHNDAFYITGVFYNSPVFELSPDVKLKNSGSYDAFLAKINPHLEPEWITNVAGVCDEKTTSIVTDRSGNYYAVGYYNSALLNFTGGIYLENAGQNDGFIAKYDAVGTCLWAQNISGEGDESVNKIAIDDNGNLYIAGSYTSPMLQFNNGIRIAINSGLSDGFVAMYDASGNCQWAQNISGDKEDTANSITVASTGEIYAVGGYKSSTLDFNGSILRASAGGIDGFLAIYDSRGICRNSVQISGTNDDIIKDVKVLGNGDGVLVGYFNSPILDLLGFRQLVNSTKTIPTYDAFVAQFDKGGNITSASNSHGEYNEYFTSIAVRDKDEMYVTGWFDDVNFDFNGISFNNASGTNITDDAFVLSLRAGGHTMWGAKIGDFTGITFSNEHATGVSIDEHGVLAVVGDYDSRTIKIKSATLTNSGRVSGFLAEYDAAGGAFFGATGLDGNKLNKPTCVTFGTNCSVYAGGAFNSDIINFNNGISLDNATEYDAFVAKYENIVNAPVLSYPADYANVVPTYFGWTTSPFAISYQIEIADNPGFNPCYIVSSVQGTTYKPTKNLPCNSQLYWRIKAIGPCSSAYTEYSQFYTINDTNVTLISPLDDAQNVSITPTFKWQTLTGASKYTLEIADNPGFSPLFFTTIVNAGNPNITTTLSYKLTNPKLNCNTTYWWRVKAENYCGIVGSDEWYFTTINNLYTPNLLSPLNGATNVSVPVTLKWSALPGADSYDVEIADNPGFSPILATGTTASLYYNFNNLSCATTYYWHVRAKNACGIGPWTSTPWEFTTKQNHQPILVNPIGFGDMLPTFEWYNPVNCIGFEFELASDPLFNNLIEHLFWTGNIAPMVILPYTLSPSKTLICNTTYYWRVRSKYDCGYSDWNETSFVTQPPIVMNPPVLISPIGNVDAALYPTFSWNSVTYGYDYEIQVSDDPNFSNIIIDQTVHALSYTSTVALKSGTTYYWRVLAKNSCVNGTSSAWSDVASFVTKNSIYLDPCSNLVTQWAKRIGGNSGDEVKSVATDATGNVYVVGYFTSDNLLFNSPMINTAPGRADSYLVKYNSAGVCQWALRIFGDADDYANTVAVGPTGEIFVGGTFTSRVINFSGPQLTNPGTSKESFLTKFNSTGTCLWAKIISGPGEDQINGLCVDNANNVYFVGYFTSPTLTFNYPPQGTIRIVGAMDAFVAKYSPIGDFVWAKDIGGVAGEEHANSIAFNVGNNTIAVTGEYRGANALTFPGGATLAPSPGFFDVFLSTHDINTGNCNVPRKIYGTQNDFGRSVVCDRSGNIYLGGSFFSPSLQTGGAVLTNTSTNHSDGFIAKYTSNLTFAWAKIVSGAGDESVNRLAFNCENIYAVGNVIGNTNLGTNIIFSSSPTNISLFDNSVNDGFLAKFNYTTGDCLAAQILGGSTYDNFDCLAVDQTANVFTGGSFESSVLVLNNKVNLNNFHTSGTYNSIAYRDGFIAKYAIPGVSISGQSVICPTMTETYYLSGVMSCLNYNWSYTGSGVTLTPNSNGSVTIVFGPNATSGYLMVSYRINACTVLSTSIYITIYCPPCIGPSADPVADIYACDNDPMACFTVSASNTDVYKWYLTPPNSSVEYPATNGGLLKISGNTICIAPITLALDGMKFRVDLINSCGTTSTNEFTLHVRTCGGDHTGNKTQEEKLTIKGDAPFAVGDLIPNPATTNFAVNINASANSSYDLTLFNSLGELVINTKYELLKGDNTINMNLTSEKGILPSGAYYLQITSNGITVTKRLIVMP